jgi:3'-5' exoribonuclease
MDQAKTTSEPAINDRELRDGEELCGVFACTGKQLVRSAVTRKPYLVVDLRDRRGLVAARAFREPHLVAEGFEPGGLVEASGMVRRYRGDLQLHLASIHAVPGDPTALLPHSYRDLEEIEGFLEQFARDVDDPELATLLTRILGEDELRAAWRRAPCAPHRHYGYCGGALEHSISVAALADALPEVHLRLDADLLLTAALLHELGRAYEFEYGIDFRLTERGRLFGHTQLGTNLIAERSQGVVAPERRDALLHCILFAAGGIPGERERHVKREPLPEAIALRGLCALDAEVKAAFEDMPGGPDLTKTNFDESSGNGDSTGPRGPELGEA